MDDNIYKKRKVRIAHLVSHPVQYLVPVYRELSKSPDIDFTVYFFSDTSLGKHFDVEFGRTVAPDGKPIGLPGWGCDIAAADS